MVNMSLSVKYEKPFFIVKYFFYSNSSMAKLTVWKIVQFQWYQYVDWVRDNNNTEKLIWKTYSGFCIYDGEWNWT